MNPKFRLLLGINACMLIAACGGGGGKPATVILTPPPSPPPSSTSPPVGTDVLTYKNDLSRSGQNLSESTLNPVNVNPSTFGLLRNLPVDGKVDAQPLYVSQLSISGSAHNTVFAATEHDSVYAFDADTGSVLWQVSLLGTGETLSDARGCDQVTPEIGITSTPVIDRGAGAHGIIFVVAMSKDVGSRGNALSLHAYRRGLARPAACIAAARAPFAFRPGGLRLHGVRRLHRRLERALSPRGSRGRSRRFRIWICRICGSDGHGPACGRLGGRTLW